MNSRALHHRKIKVVLFIGLILAQSYAEPSCEASNTGMHVYIQGINLEWLKTRNWTAVIAGAATGFLVHEASHVFAAKAQGQSVDWQWYDGGPYQLWGDGNGDQAYLWTARSGWVGELAVGLLLNLLPQTRGSDFTMGYSAAGTIRLLAYNMPSGGDFDSIRNEGGHDRIEWFIMTGMSSILTINSIFDSTRKQNGN